MLYQCKKKGGTVEFIALLFWRFVLTLTRNKRDLIDIQLIHDPITYAEEQHKIISKFESCIAVSEI